MRDNVKWLLVAVISLTLLTVLPYAVCVNSPMYKGESLYIASVSQEYDEMRELLESGAPVDYLFDGTTSSLSQVIEHQDARAVALLLNYGASRESISAHHQRMLDEKTFASKVKVERAKSNNQPRP